jgi:hypothetical protein
MKIIVLGSEFDSWDHRTQAENTFSPWDGIGAVKGGRAMETHHHGHARRNLNPRTVFKTCVSCREYRRREEPGFH